MYDDNIKDYKDLKKIISSMRMEIKSYNNLGLNETSLNKVLPFNYIFNINLGCILILLRNFMFTKIMSFSTAKFILRILNRPLFIFRTILVAAVVFGFIKLRNKCK